MLMHDVEEIQTNIYLINDFYSWSYDLSLLLEFTTQFVFSS